MHRFMRIINQAMTRSSSLSLTIVRAGRAPPASRTRCRPLAQRRRRAKMPGTEHTVASVDLPAGSPTGCEDGIRGAGARDQTRA
jgi:hypothetical protein